MVPVLELVDRLIKRLHAVLIDARHRLVEDQQIRLRRERQRQQHALQLAAGERAQRPVRQLRAVRALQRGKHSFARFFGDAQEHRPPRQRASHEIHDRHRRGAVKLQLLGHIARAQVGGGPPVTGKMADGAGILDLSEQRAQQRRLARTVRADQRGQLAAVDVQAHILERRLRAKGHGQLVHLDAAEPAARFRARQMRMRTGRLLLFRRILRRELALSQGFDLFHHSSSASVSTRAFSLIAFS